MSTERETRSSENGSNNNSIRDPNASEATPLVTASTRTSVISSTRSTESASHNVFGFSSHWLDTADQKAEEKFRSERERAVKKGIVEAAFLIRDAVMGEKENPSKGTYDPYINPENSIRNMFSLVFRRILSLRPLRQSLIASAWILVILTFIEPPRWCARGEGELECHELFKLKGPPPGGNHTLPESEWVEYYPGSRSILLTEQQSNIIEYICISFISIIILMRIGRDGCSLKTYLRRGPAQWSRITQIISIVILVIGLQSGQNVLNPFGRLSLLATFVPSVQEEVKTLFKVVCLSIFILFARIPIC